MVTIAFVKEINGKKVINFSVAHSEKYKDAQGNQKERTTWVECAYWTDKTAVAQYLTKGKTVYAEGAPEADAYMNKENQAAATLRMRVQNLQLLGSSGNAGEGGGGYSQSASSSAPAAHAAPASAAVANAMSDAADDLPF